MQAQGVRIAPYINGRIFDQATKSWNNESKSASAKQIDGPTLITDPSKLELQTYNESYGSKAVFAVMCPHTAYWQDKIFSVVRCKVLECQVREQTTLKNTGTKLDTTFRYRWSVYRSDRGRWSESMFRQQS